MSRFTTQLALVLGCFVLTSLFGAALAAAVDFDQLSLAKIRPSDIPNLLGPITEAGRVGWTCKPEAAARARQADAAQLPVDAP